MQRISLISALIAAAVLGGAGAAQAQEYTVDSNFSVQLFEPVPGPDNFVNVEGTRIGSNLSFTVGLMLHYQYRPFVLYPCATGTGGEGEPACELESDGVAIIDHQLMGDILASISVLKLFTVGLAIPATLYQTGNQLDVQSGTGAGDLPSWGGLGDMRLYLKFRFWPFMEERQEGFGFALAPSVNFPIGQFFDDGPQSSTETSGSFMGSDLPTVNVRAVVDYFDEMFHVALQLGYFWRTPSTFYDHTLSENGALTYGLGFGVWAIPELEIFLELFGRNEFTLQIDRSPFEADLGVKYRVGDFVLTAGAGTGLVGLMFMAGSTGIGAPAARAFLGFAYAPTGDEALVVESDDRDADGYLNDLDGCPDDPEDFDQFEDENGCSDPDNDQDGVLDNFDACLLEPEDRDGYKDEDGCVDLDHDEDGILTPTDACPDNPEDFDGYADADGCPEDDNDSDGLPDATDVCPDDPEDFDAFQDDDGCPEPDNDLDGIPDRTDECADEPETLNGVNDEDGCPDRGQTLVVVTAEQIEIKQQVNFATDSDRIVGRQSFDILNVVATVLRLNPQYTIEVQGHTDNRGSYEHNTDLSQRRAEAVRTYLIGQGVAGERLTARGYGPDVPIADNGTGPGRAKNRRVEFHMVSAAGADLGESMPAPPAEGGEAVAPPVEGGDTAVPPAEGGDTMNF